MVAVLQADLWRRFAPAVIAAILLALLGRMPEAIIWMTLISVNEIIEVNLNRALLKNPAFRPRILYAHLLNWVCGGSMWSGLAIYLWTSWNTAENLFAIAIIIGGTLHVAFNYSDWWKGAFCSMLPLATGLLVLPTMVVFGEADVTYKIVVATCFATLFYYAVTTTNKFIRKQAELRRAIIEAASANKSKSAFLANMSHEIRTPMNGVLGMAALLDETVLSPRQKEMVDIIQASGDTLIRVIDDVLDLSKIEAGQINLEIKAFNLEDLINTISATAEVRALEKQLLFVRDVDAAQALCLMGDEIRIRQIVSNLVSNAIKFTETGTITLRVSTQLDEDAQTVHTAFDVIDTGPGISEYEQTRIFLPFMQGDVELSRIHGGTGLGLSIANQFAQQMGGKLSVQSELGKGSTFRFSCVLPVATEECADGRTCRPVTEHDAQPVMAPDLEESFTILVAEDHPQNRRMLELMLEPLNPELIFAVNGEEAVRMYQTNKVQLIIMDIQMPIMDGVSALKAIREIEAETDKRRVPIIALTAHAMKHQVEQYLADGFDDHIAKPVRAVDLITKLDQVRDYHTP